MRNKGTGCLDLATSIEGSHRIDAICIKIACVERRRRIALVDVQADLEMCVYVHVSVCLFVYAGLPERREPKTAY